MTDQQFKRAQELHKLAAPIMDKRDYFKEAVEHAITVQIQLPKGNYFGFRPDELPEAAQVIFKSMLAAMAAACDTEVKRIEKEFNEL